MGMGTRRYVGQHERRDCTLAERFSSALKQNTITISAVCGVFSVTAFFIVISFAQSIFNSGPLVFTPATFQRFISDMFVVTNVSSLEFM